MDVAGVSARGVEKHPRALIVAELFARTFELDTVDINADFFGLGGDSLLAEELLVAIEERFGTVLSPSVLVESPTPVALAALVGDPVRNVATPLFVARDGSGPPLYCVHGLTGVSLLPNQLAGAMTTTVPVLGFRAVGLEDGELALTTIDAMADRYLAAIAERNRHQGPYLLLGICGGAMIAYEMARKLIERGETVAGLVMIDPEVQSLAPFLNRSGLSLAYKYLRRALRVRRLEWRISRRVDVSAEARRRLVANALNMAVIGYRPKPLHVPALFLHTPEREAELLNPRTGYRTLLPGGRFVKLDTTHDRMFAERLADIVRLIEEFMAEVRTPAWRFGE